LFSFNDSIYIAFPLKAFTTKWYEEMFANQQLHAALVNSLRVGATTAVFATILGVFGAKAVTQYRMPGRKPMVFTIMLPLVIPGIIMGVALLILVSRLGIPLSLYTVTLGHVLICVPFSMATLIARFEGFDRSMEEAAADLGDNAWWTFWRVTFPIVFLAGYLPDRLPRNSCQPVADVHGLLRRIHHGVLPVQHRTDLAGLYVDPTTLSAEAAGRARVGFHHPGGLVRRRVRLAVAAGPRRCADSGRGR
jgi:ABC-type uncharacterized transport system permease subunit